MVVPVRPSVSHAITINNCLTAVGKTWRSQHFTPLSVRQSVTADGHRLCWSTGHLLVVTCDVYNNKICWGFVLIVDVVCVWSKNSHDLKLNCSCLMFISFFIDFNWLILCYLSIVCWLLFFVCFYWQWPWHGLLCIKIITWLSAVICHLLVLWVSICGIFCCWCRWSITCVWNWILIIDLFRVSCEMNKLESNSLGSMHIT